MRVLITGAAGCLGRKLVNKLCQECSFEIFATDIKANPFIGKITTSSLKYQRFDCRDPAFIVWLNKIRPTKVIHLASILQLSPTMTRQQAHDIDVKATETLLSTCLTLKVDKFIVTTSGAAYGYYPENKQVISEDRAIKGNQDYFYSAHKAEVEQLMMRYREEHPQLQQIIFRPGAILGPDFDGPVVNLFQQKMITGILGYPGPFNFIWSEDVIDYLIEGLTSEITGEFNIAGDGALTLKEIAQRLAKPYLALPALLIQAVLAIAKPLGLTQYGPEQVKFIKYRPVLANDKIKAEFTHQPRYTSSQALDAFLAVSQEKK